jgi:hypothetical protein
VCIFSINVSIIVIQFDAVLPTDAGINIFIGLKYLCITIIDTIILTNYTNNAYTYDTYPPLSCR